MANSIDRLKSQLLKSGLQSKDQVLFQIINQLIDAVSSNTSSLSSTLAGGGSGGAASSAATYITEDIEAGLPNSRQIIAGSGINIQHTPNGRTVIHSAIPLTDSSGGEGEDGPPGPPGKDGKIGPQGSNAISQFYSFDGIDGEDAPIMPGPQGISGSTGPAGLIGSQGIPGDDGNDGLDSLIPGPIGLQGQKGDSGFQLLPHELDLDEIIPIPLIADPSNIAYLNRIQNWSALQKFVDFITVTFTASSSGYIPSLEVATLLNLSGGQIQFPVVQIPSASANVLDDYEEGTWTPIDVSGAGLVFPSVVGTYTKIGNRVCIDVLAQYPVTANGAIATIGGLPFVCNAITAGALAPRFINAAFTYTLNIPLSNTTINMFTNTGVGVTNANLSNTFVAASGIYFV